jgi:flagellar basal body rod protein FlgG
MVNMIAAQRAYELNSKCISTADQMLQTVNAMAR